MPRNLLPILFLVCSCAVTKPLKIPVGFFNDSMIAWQAADGNRWETPAAHCDECVVLLPEDFGELLEQCKRDRK